MIAPDGSISEQTPIPTVLGEPRCYTAGEVAAAAGISLTRARRYLRALGYPQVGDGVIEFTSADVAVLRMVAAHATEGTLDEPESLRVLRVLSCGIANLAQVQAEIVADQSNREPNAPIRIEELVRRVPEIQWLLGEMWRRQFADALSVFGPAAEDMPEAIGVGFADIVGFTELSARRSARDLSRIIARFEYRVTEIVADCGGSVVKMLGDEVLFTADSPPLLADLATRLVSAFEAEPDIPGLRVGLAFGPVVRQLGDIFGTTVNLASRLTRLAEPDTIVVAPAVATALDHHPTFEVARRAERDIRGIGPTVPAVLSRR
ncbi:adenylate/guanylate cyclase domain-containing protein [Nocardia goodfellowii]